LATQRSEYRAAVAVIGVIPQAYLALVVAGVDSAVAGMWALGFAAGPLSLAWLAAVALGSRAIRLLLYWAAVAYSRPRGIAVHGWGYTVVRTILLVVLTFCVLSLGSRYGQRRNANTGTMSR